MSFLYGIVCGCQIFHGVQTITFSDPFPESIQENFDFFSQFCGSKCMLLAAATTPVVYQTTFFTRFKCSAVAKSRFLSG